MSIQELRALIESKTVEVRGFLDENKSEEAKTAMEELRALKDNLKIAEELEEEEKRDLESQRDLKSKEKRSNENMNETTEFRSIVKHVMGKEITKEERANIKTTDNSAVIPKQFVNELIEIQKGYGSLKHLCDVIPVFRNTGTMPIVDLDQNELLEVAEGADIVDGTFVTTDTPFTCKKYGLIQSLTSELIDDAEVEIEGLVKKNFANIVTAKENGKILSVIKVNSVAVEGATSYEDVQKEIDKSLPSVKSGLSTLVNVSTYAELKNKKDKQGRPLELITPVNGIEHFHGKPIFVVEDDMLPTTELMKETYYIGNFAEAVKFFDRKAVTIARSTEAGFRDDTTKIRILERFDVAKGSVRSLKKIEF